MLRFAPCDAQGLLSSPVTVLNKLLRLPASQINKFRWYFGQWRSPRSCCLTSCHAQHLRHAQGGQTCSVFQPLPPDTDLLLPFLLQLRGEATARAQPHFLLPGLTILHHHHRPSRCQCQYPCCALGAGQQSIPPLRWASEPGQLLPLHLPAQPRAHSLQH